MQQLKLLLIQSCQLARHTLPSQAVSAVWALVKTEA